MIICKARDPHVGVARRPIVWTVIVLVHSFSRVYPYTLGVQCCGWGRAGLDVAFVVSTASRGARESQGFTNSGVANRCLACARFDEGDETLAALSATRRLQASGSEFASVGACKRASGTVAGAQSPGLVSRSV